MPTYLLAHDLGTSGNKATLFTAEGKLVKSAMSSYPLRIVDGNGAEQDPMDWWRAVCLSTRELVEGIDTKDIAAVSFSGQMMGCVLVDSEGNPVRDALIWADLRSDKQAEQIRTSMSEGDFYQITGHRISSSHSLTKLMWVKEQTPDAYTKACKMLNAKDYIVFKLTGQFVTEPSDASSTCLMNLNTRDWSEDLIEASGIDRRLLPDIVPSITVVGGVTLEASRACGLLVGTPVVCGGGDGVCAAVGTGVVSENKANLCLGTSSWISYASKHPLISSDMTTFHFAHIVPGYVLPCGTMQTGGGALSWAVKAMGELFDSDDGIYERINHAVADSPVGAKGLLFLPYLMGERSPRWNPLAKGSFVGLSLEHSGGDLFRAVMEGVAMNLSLILEAFCSQGASLDRLILVGGGARNIVWRQILADVLGVKIEVPSVLEEATSMGAAITAGVGVGVLSSFEAADLFLQREQEYQPNVVAEAQYRKWKHTFETCYRAVEPLFPDLAQFTLN